MSLKRRANTTGPRDDLGSEQLYISSSIEDRSSTFIAHFSPSVPAKRLQAHPEFKSASHRIAAWRTPSKQLSLRPERLFDTGYDDDGESWAGKRLEKVLDEMKVEGAVVVARWYGGILLGPVRFNHIENCAREAIKKYLDENRSSARNDGPIVKRAKVVEDVRTKEVLVQTLNERDESIQVLRGLLKEKQNAAQKLEPSGQEQSTQSSPAKPSYEKMASEQLLKLEKARDATIGFLLKQIDTAEGELSRGKPSSPSAAKVVDSSGDG
ncbi:ribosomal protein S5 domain 2-like protein [Rhizodiscina lignyota]|uniref:Ribosomal protein S5 domain 2-like protein n=1 Tax=Rhizodiscina lignyota TaxID=1504668 RepID=A0A9P4I611_9PEZI|nr:ribosomal protein S5 domain 2-like protein [Rhizodiscina lignyota]